MRKLNVILLAVALALLVYFINRVGLASIADGFARVGWGFFLLLGVFVSAFFVETWNWSRCFRERFALRRFLIPSWCGQSINQLTPGSSLGEVVKGGLISRFASTEAVVSSLILYNMAFAFGVAVVIMSGSVGLWLLPFAPNALRVAGTVTALLLFVGLTLIFRGLVGGTLSRMLGALGHRLDSGRLERAADHVGRWEAEIGQVARETPWRFRQVVAVCVLTQAFPITEMWLTWWLLGVRLDLARCFIFAGVDTLVQLVFMIVPGKLGVAEGTTYYTAGLLKLDRATGLNKQLIARCVRLAFAICGALVLAIITLRDRRR